MDDLLKRIKEKYPVECGGGGTIPLDTFQDISDLYFALKNSYKHSSDLVFKSGGRETFRLSGTGLLPDGTITPSVKLDIQPSQNLVTKDELDAGDRLLDKMFADDQTKTSGDND